MEPIENEDTQVVNPLNPLELTDTWYNRLKSFAILYLPAFATFFATFGEIWQIPNHDQILGTIVALNLLIGAQVKLSKKSYESSNRAYDGTMHVVHDLESGGKRFTLDLDIDPFNMDDKKTITFKVDPSVENGIV